MLTNLQLERALPGDMVPKGTNSPGEVVPQGTIVFGVPNPTALIIVAILIQCGRQTRSALLHL